MWFSLISNWIYIYRKARGKITKYEWIEDLFPASGIEDHLPSPRSDTKPTSGGADSCVLGWGSKIRDVILIFLLSNNNFELKA